MWVLRTLTCALEGIRAVARPVVKAIDEAVSSVTPLDSAVMWRQWVYGLNGDSHHWICAIAVTKDRVTLDFHFGSPTSLPEGAFRIGTSRFMRMLGFDTLDSVDAALTRQRVAAALDQLDHFKATQKSRAQ